VSARFAIFTSDAILDIALSLKKRGAGLPPPLFY